ncbi:MAG: tRNA lysidine(34) synthetase TilS [Planctomycetes bacterium]|nr:tRNA lysidine(34) synthetase TilS [Planctomycetota bacterium]MDA0947453.1 tRNA lysidine(34) synthetase TilS [Planctomycetota bacterium]
MTQPEAPHPWSSRWSGLAQAAGLRPEQPVALGLSGGADSVLLLHLLARAAERPRVLAIHADHGLRGEASHEDAAFCARLCARLGVPFARVRLELDPSPAGLEARARKARYEALAREAEAAGIPILLTGHHADDALETLLQRWTRGSALPGLPGLKRLHTHASGVQIVRPLITLRREEVRRLLRDEGLEWREDASNQDPVFTRTRVREGLLPALDRETDGAAMEGLRAFARAVEGLEDELASRTAHLSWQPDATGCAQLPRSEVACLPQALRRRVLWRLVQEGSGGSPGKTLLDGIIEDLEAHRPARHSLPGGWLLDLTADELCLLPPGSATPEPRYDLDPEARPLAVPGRLRLPDGRVLVAELVQASGCEGHPLDPSCVELDAELLGTQLEVRAPREGDTVHPLGAPGSRKLTRFLADAGVPAQDRPTVPLVLAAGEVVWVAGVRPTDHARLRGATRSRVRLSLLPSAPRESAPTDRSGYASRGQSLPTHGPA